MTEIYNFEAIHLRRQTHFRAQEALVQACKEALEMALDEGANMPLETVVAFDAAVRVATVIARR